MKVYLDDERETPEGWTRVYSSKDCINLLSGGRVTELSLDHDLGTDEDNGYKVLLWLEEQVANKFFVPPIIRIHTANASARVKMELAVKSIESLQKRNKEWYDFEPIGD